MYPSEYKKICSKRMIDILYILNLSVNLGHNYYLKKLEKVYIYLLKKKKSNNNNESDANFIKKVGKVYFYFLKINIFFDLILLFRTRNIAFGVDEFGRRLRLEKLLETVYHCQRKKNAKIIICSRGKTLSRPGEVIIECNL